MDETVNLVASFTAQAGNQITVRKNIRQVRLAKFSWNTARHLSAADVKVLYRAAARNGECCGDMRRAVSFLVRT